MHPVAAVGRYIRSCSFFGGARLQFFWQVRACSFLASYSGKIFFFNALQVPAAESDPNYRCICAVYVVSQCVSYLRVSANSSCYRSRFQLLQLSILPKCPHNEPVEVLAEVPDGPEELDEAVGVDAL